MNTFRISTNFPVQWNSDFRCNISELLPNGGQCPCVDRTNLNCEHIWNIICILKKISKKILKHVKYRDNSTSQWGKEIGVCLLSFPISSFTLITCSLIFIQALNALTDDKEWTDNASLMIISTLPLAIRLQHASPISGIQRFRDNICSFWTGYLYK